MLRQGNKSPADPRPCSGEPVASLRRRDGEVRSGGFPGLEGGLAISPTPTASREDITTDISGEAARGRSRLTTSSQASSSIGSPSLQPSFRAAAT